jgi:Co/Zn/Cd efflux system component
MWSARASALLEAALSGRESRALLSFVGALSALALAQSAYGVAAGSLGLIADAFHTVFHVIAMLTSLWGMLHARQTPTFAFSYASRRERATPQERARERAHARSVRR